MTAGFDTLYQRLGRTASSDAGLGTKTNTTRRTETVDADADGYLACHSGGLLAEFAVRAPRVDADPTCASPS